MIDWVQKPRAPYDFSAALDALRVLREAAIHQPETARWMEMTEALDVLEDYVYDRVTDKELAARAPRVS